MAKKSIAVVNLDHCQPDRCNYECANYCPPNRTGKDCIVTRGDFYDSDDLFVGRPEQIRISEEICLGETCGICIKRCPFDAIEIINLPSELDESPIHRYGENTFVLYGLPAPKSGSVIGLLGPNGIGKTTSLKVLSGSIVPNLGDHSSPATFESAISNYKGTSLQNYLEKLQDGSINVAHKPQYVESIPHAFEGTTRNLLENVDERGELDNLIEELSLKPLLENDIKTLSGGELQRVAIAATLARDADFYFLDDLTPFLDIKQRIAAANVIRNIAISENRSILVVEHDLAILDLIADSIHIAYGTAGGFGVVTDIKSTRSGINEYLSGFLKNENMRVRPQSITFDQRAPKINIETEPLLSYPLLEMTYETGFSLTVKPGIINQHEVLGVVGPNGIGKSTFANILAGEQNTDSFSLDSSVSISYKPQYLDSEESIRVDTYLANIASEFGTSYWNTEIALPLQLDKIMSQNLPDLSGGERQRVAIAACLSASADLYLLDEPSAHLDVEQRSQATRAIRRFAEHTGASVMVIDHDIYMLDLLVSRLLVFSGTPSEFGTASTPADMRTGMNEFLSNLGITFRRDERTQRPRVNKPGSQKDKEQIKSGEYYYLPAE